MSVIGKGVAAYPFGRAGGTLRNFRSPDDVIDAIDDDLEATIALVEAGGTTFLSPILGRLAGVVCRTGTLRSHLAIVSREFEVPCVLGAELPEVLPDGTSLVLEAVEGAGLVRAGALETAAFGPDSERAGAGGPGGGETSTTADSGAAATGKAAAGTPRHGEPTTGDVSDRWWSYIRRVGDETGVKDFDLVVDPEALDRLIAEPLDDDRLDDLVGHMGRAFKPEMTRRSGFTSELFPMLPYMSLSVIEDFHSYPARVAAIDAVMPAEEIGRRLRAAPGLASPLWIWMVGYHYLTGRECLIKMGRLRPDERREEIRTVVDFWRRLALGMRGDGTLDYKDAGFTNRYLPANVVTELAGAATVLDAGSAKALRRLNATVSGYTFLYFCESRVGVCDSGPYPLADGRQVLVRDFLSLGPSAWDYPWARNLQPPYQGLTLALIFDPEVFTSFEINDWGTTFTEPDQLLGAVTEAAVFGHRSDGTRRLFAPHEWEDPIGELSHAHLDLYRGFVQMDRRERIFAATRMYTSGLRPFAQLAGATDAVDWSLSPDTLALHPDPFDDDDRAAEIFGGAVVANDLPGSYSPIR